MKTSTLSCMIVLLFFAVNLSAQKAISAGINDNATIVVTKQKQVDGKLVVVETTKTAGEIRAEQQLARKQTELKQAKAFLQNAKHEDPATLQTKKFQKEIADTRKRVEVLERELSIKH